MSNRLDLLQDMPLHIRGYRRQIIQQGPMKMKDSKNNQDVYCYLFSDMFLITKGGKRSGTINSSLTTTTNDGQSNRPTSNVLNKILKPPIRIDRIDVREYDRRGGNSNNTEPNTVRLKKSSSTTYPAIRRCGHECGGMRISKGDDTSTVSRACRVDPDPIGSGSKTFG
jgi:hypothetical protein